MTKRLKYLSCRERLSELGLLSPEKRRLSDDLINMYKFVKGRGKEDGIRVFSMVPGELSI